MAIPVSSDLESMDYVYNGQPFVNVPAKSTIDLTTMDYVYLGQPFVGNASDYTPTPPTGNTGNFFLVF